MRKLFLFALVATMFAACVTDETQDVAVELAPDTLTVSFEDADSRIQLDNGKTVWTKGDLASVFYRSNANQKWQYQGETGERTGNLKRVNAGSAAETMKRVVVVYPYSENYYINTDTYNVEASLPATQTYLANSYGVGGNIMISQSEFNQFSLKSVCGWLKIQLTGNGEKVKSIKLKGNAGEQVAGLIYINSATAEATLAAEMGSADDNENTAGGNLIFDDTILTEVVLDCGEGVELGAEATAFYIGLPPQTFAQGLTIEIEDTNALKMTKSTDKEVVISRNTIQPMAAFEYAGDFDKSEYCLVTEFEVDEERLIIGGYYHNLPAGEDNPLVNIDYGDGTFGKENNHTYAAAGRYTVKLYFEKPITEIAQSSFSSSRMHSITIPKDVTKIGSMAFNNSNLASISFEKESKLTTIEQGAFVYCRNLKSIYLPISVTEIGDCVFGGCYSLESIDGGARGFSTAWGVFYKWSKSIDCHVIAYPASLNLEIVSYGPNRHDIGWGAFVGCKYLKDLDIIISKIYQHNFMECEKLEYIRLDQTTYIENDVIKNCPKLKEINLPLASEIGEYCFINNESLTSINLGCDELKTISAVGNNNISLSTLWIPSGVESITDSFNTCAAIAEVYCKAAIPPVLINSFDAIPATAKIYVPYTSKEAYKTAEGWSQYADMIVGYDFEKGEVMENIPETWKIYYTATAKVVPYKSDGFGANIVSNEWDETTGEGVITFDGEVTAIGPNAFHSLYEPQRYLHLKTITIPDNVTSIGDYAFRNCSSLTNVAIPNSITAIGEYAFYNCDNLTSIILDGVETIKGHAFQNCDSITEIIIPDSVTEIGEYAFDYCSSLATVYIGKGVEIIESYTFSCCSSLTSITIPDNVTLITYGAFEYCPSLKSVTIGNGVTEIGNGAFRSCESLTSVTIGKRVTSIGDYAFYDCTSLKEAYCKPTTPPTGGRDMFYNNASDCKIYVPRASVEAYKAKSYWSSYASYIEGYDF